MKTRSLFFMLLSFAIGGGAGAAATAPRIIRVSTADTELVFAIDEGGRLYQTAFGPAGAYKPEQETAAVQKGKNKKGRGNKPAFAREDEAYPQFGNGFLAEPALQVTHADGNTSTDLVYVSHASSEEQGKKGVTLTRIELADGAYAGFKVALCFRAYHDENIIEQWAEISNGENGPVTLSRFASASLVENAKDGNRDYHLTQLHGTYSHEATLAEEKLFPGIKILDTKLGVRAHYYRAPAFILSLDGPAREESGRVIGATLEWSGNFQFAFELDYANRLRVLCGINPFAAAYHLAPGKTFTTPALLYTFSAEGKGGMSRAFHRWARAYGIRDGAKPRPVLLNNWEATHFDFDEAKITSLFDGAKELGADIFLLDDGWFGNKHPRVNDKAGLGDWEPNAKRLPNGLSHLAAAATAKGIGFGIWIEPEMVNPASELFEKHPDWVIAQPKREHILFRNQLILDNTRPEVRAFERGIIDRTLGGNPGITYVKWDCNRYVTQAGSGYLPADEQSHLLIDYQWHLYDLMKHMAGAYPNVMAMLCSGGPGRVDYAALRYFHSFWASDDTDPAQRIYIQWGFSQFFPSNTISAHVTDMGRRPLKFAIDVALSGAFGIDRDVARWTPAERAQVAAAVKLYHERIRPITADGDLYRLASPYETPHAALEFVAPDRASALIFIYAALAQNPADASSANSGGGANSSNAANNNSASANAANNDSVSAANNNSVSAAYPDIKPLGLDPSKTYRVREINLAPGAKSALSIDGQRIPGAVLMRDGFPSPLKRALESAVIDLSAE